MNAATATETTKTILVVSRSVASRCVDADVRVRVEDGAVVLSATAVHGDRTAEISTRFAFDGDLVALRGFGKAADDLAAKINQARHQGLEVAR